MLGLRRHFSQMPSSKLPSEFSHGPSLMHEASNRMYPGGLGRVTINGNSPASNCFGLMGKAFHSRSLLPTQQGCAKPNPAGERHTKKANLPQRSRRPHTSAFHSHIYNSARNTGFCAFWVCISSSSSSSTIHGYATTRPRSGFSAHRGAPK